jgi:hypothetical protein
MPALATAVETAELPVAQAEKAEQPRRGFVVLPYCPEVPNPPILGWFKEWRERA